MTNKKPLFDLGQIVATPGALEALEASGEAPAKFLALHASGQWGEELSQDDKDLNDAALVDGSRLLSCYRTKQSVRLYLITEAEDDEGHRAATTILLPEEY
jgi:hypothetical protein